MGLILEARGVQTQSSLVFFWLPTWLSLFRHFLFFLILWNFVESFPLQEEAFVYDNHLTWQIDWVRVHMMMTNIRVKHRGFGKTWPMWTTKQMSLRTQPKYLFSRLADCWPDLICSLLALTDTSWNMWRDTWGICVVTRSQRRFESTPFPEHVVWNWFSSVAVPETRTVVLSASRD